MPVGVRLQHASRQMKSCTGVAHMNSCTLLQGIPPQRQELVITDAGAQTEYGAVTPGSDLHVLVSRAALRGRSCAGTETISKRFLKVRCIL